MTERRINWNSMIDYQFWLRKSFKDEVPVSNLTIKLSEEVEEFNEVLLREMGYKLHESKEWKDTTVEVAADIINLLIGILVKHHPDKTPGEISNELYNAIKKSGEKYDRSIRAEENLFVE